MYCKSDVSPTDKFRKIVLSSFFNRTLTTAKQHDQHQDIHVKSENTITHFNIRYVKINKENKSVLMLKLS